MHAGDAVWNPVSGEKLLVVAGTADGDGDYLALDYAVEAGGFVALGTHDHPGQRITIETVAGAFELELDGEPMSVEDDEVAIVEAGRRHRLRKVGEGEARARIYLEPALRSEELILAAWGLVADGEGGEDGLPTVQDLKVLAREYAAELRCKGERQTGEQFEDSPARVPDYRDLTRHPSAAPGLGRLPEEVRGRNPRER